MSTTTDTQVAHSEALAAWAIRERCADQDRDELAWLVLYLTEHRFRPDRVLEVGVSLGGTMALWRALWPYALLLGVDLHPPGCDVCTTLQPWQSHPLEDCPSARLPGTLVLGDSHEVGTLNEVRRLAYPRALGDRWSGGETEPEAELNFLHIDGDHSYEGCLADLHDYGPLVAPGGLIVVHDVAGFPEVAAAWSEWSEGREQAFTICTSPAGRYGMGLCPVLE